MKVFLVITSVIGGPHYGPVVTMEPMETIESCQVLRESVAQSILLLSKDEYIDPELVHKDKYIVVNVKGHEGMRLSCETDSRTTRKSS